MSIGQSVLFVVAMALVAVRVAGAQPAALDSLTVPAAALPEGCVPVPAATERVGGTRVRSGLWAGLPIDTNPWTGASWRVLSKIRSEMFGPPRTPDALPDSRLNAKLGRDLVEGLTGYAAFYRQGDAWLAVYALRSAERLDWTRGSPVEHDGSVGSAVVRLGRGDLKVMAFGDRGACFTAVAHHFRAAIDAMAPALAEPK